MMRRIFALTSVIIGTLALPVYSVYAHTFEVNRYDVGGDEGTDYLTVEPDTNRIFVSRTTHVMVIDGLTGKVVGDVADTRGIHGIALAPKWNHGFTTNGADSSLTMFNLKTLAAIKKIFIPSGGLDGITYDGISDKIILTNHGHPNGSVVLIDPDSGRQTNEIKLEDELPEGATTDGKGKLFVNGKKTDKIYVISLKSMSVVKSWPLKPCESPTGIAYDQLSDRIFVGCANFSVVMNPSSGKVIASIPNGADVDGLGWDSSEKIIYIPAGANGIVSIFHQDSPNNYSAVTTMSSAVGAKTIAVDSITHRAYLFQPEYGPFTTSSASRSSASSGHSSHGPVTAAYFYVITH